MRIGVLGGTFNPIHCAHIRTALAAKSALSLDRVLLMVAADPPHKQVAGAVPAQVRLHMTALAAEEYQGLEASALELHRAGKSYTADTLLSLHKQYPEDELFLLVGSDMLRDLPNWYRPDCICRLAVIAVVPRGGCDAEDADRAQLLMKEFGARVVFLPVAPQTLSSTEIRDRLYRGLPVTGLLPPAVETELYESGIYSPERIHALQQRCRAALTENGMRIPWRSCGARRNSAHDMVQSRSRRGLQRCCTIAQNVCRRPCCACCPVTIRALRPYSMPLRAQCLQRQSTAFGTRRCFARSVCTVRGMRG